MTVIPKTHIDPYLYIYAGQGEKGRSLGDMYTLNIGEQTFEWKRMFLIEPPNPHHSHTLVGFKNNSSNPEFEQKKILFGGLTTPDNTMYNDIWVLNYRNVVDIPRDDTISGCSITIKDTTGEKPKKRKGHAAFCYNNAMYVFGGSTIKFGEETTDKIHILDLGSWVW